MAKLRLSNGRLRRFGGQLALLTPGAAAAPAPAPAPTDFGIAMIGQSNMANRPATGRHFPLGHPSAYDWSGSAWRRISNVNDALAVGTPWSGAVAGGYSSYTASGATGDGQVYLANLIASGLGVRARLINKALGGTSINQWLTVANGGTAACWTPFVTALDAAAAALSTTPAALLRLVIWHQGEQDAAGMSATTYKAKLALLHAQCKVLAGDSTDFRFGVTSLGPGSYNSSQEGDFGKLRVAQVEYATATPGAFLAACAYDTGTINPTNSTGDGVHIQWDGFNKLNRREAKAALHALGATSAATGLGGSGAGPRITGATRSGNVVTVSVAHAGGNTLQDGAGGAGASLTGFRVFDNGSPVTISATAITSPTAITLTLASTPTGTVTMDHAVMNTPCHTGSGPYTFVPAGCVYDNDGYWQYPGTASTTLGSPLQPWSGTVTGG